MATIDLSNLDIFLNDSILYKNVSERVATGEAYYNAARNELASMGFPRGSMFNWRLPVYAWLFAILPPRPYAAIVLSAALIAGLVMASTIVGWEGGRAMGFTVAAVLTLTTGGWCFYPEPVYYMELWCGVALLIAASLQSSGRFTAAAAVGAIALAIRELALPFCLVFCAYSWVRGRRRDALVWSIVILIFFLCMYVHSKCIGKADLRVVNFGTGQWTYFGGTTFLLSCCRMTYPLAALPTWCMALYLPMALLGLFGWSSRRALPFQMATATYLVLFALVGKPLNFYWGWVFTPLLAIGAALSPVALRDLIIAAIPLQHPECIRTEGSGTIEK